MTEDKPSYVRVRFDEANGAFDMAVPSVIPTNQEALAHIAQALSAINNNLVTLGKAFMKENN